LLLAIGMLPGTGALAAVHQAQSGAISRSSPATVAESADAAKAVAQFRADMRSILDQYGRRYGARLAPTERDRMAALIQKVDNDLGRLERTARATARQVKAGKPRLAATSARQALVGYQRSYAEATATLAEVQPILAPHLGLLEALEAKSQVDQQFARFRLIGEQLASVERSLTPG
jgi:thioesterase domain-containing protein